MSDFLTLKGGEVDVGGAPEVISVLPFGHVVSQKGEFDVDEESLAAMKAQIAERGVDLVVDYEHQTLSVANIKNVIKKYSPSARVNGLNKEKLLQLLEDIRKTNNITNADLCNKFADEIYLPKIVLKKADIPLSLRSQFIDLR